MCLLLGLFVAHVILGRGSNQSHDDTCHHVGGDIILFNLPNLASTYNTSYYSRHRLRTHYKSLTIVFAFAGFQNRGLSMRILDEAYYSKEVTNRLKKNLPIPTAYLQVDRYNSRRGNA